MDKQSKVTIKGTGQLNGPIVINKTVEMDSSMANKFMGSNRYQVIESFLNTNYPGVKVNPKDFSVNVIPLNSSSTKSSTSKSSSSSKSNSASGKSILSKTGNAIAGTASVIGAIGGFLLNSDDEEDEENKKTDEFNINKEKEKLDFEYYKKQKEVEFEHQQLLLKKNLKQEKVNLLKQDLNDGGNKFVYLIKRLWLFLDKPWKKIAFFIFLFYFYIFSYEFVFQSKDRNLLVQADTEFKTVIEEAKVELEAKNYEKVDLLINKMNSIIDKTNISNEFVLDEIKSKKIEWESTISEIKNLKDIKQKK